MKLQSGLHSLCMKRLLRIQTDAIMYALVWGMIKKMGIRASRDMRVYMHGPSGSGKTTILYQLALKEVIQTIPTIGINVESFKHKGTNFTLGDVGELSTTWHHFLPHMSELILVLDCTDRTRLAEAHACLRRLLRDPIYYDANVLIFANKCDLPSRLSSDEIAAALQITSLGLLHWHIEFCSAVTGTGLEAGLDWLRTVHSYPQRS